MAPDDHQDDTPARFGATAHHRWAGLDGLRALAVLAVILHHTALGAGLPGSHPFARVAFSGYLGVDLFFVLSGFLITSLLLKEEDTQHEVSGTRSFSLRHFYIRRSLRIFPAFYAVLLVDVLLLSTIPLFASVRLAPQTLTEHPGVLVSLFTYTSNYVLSRESLAFVGIGYFAFWSLCVEEHFYLGWSVVMRVVHRHRGRLALVVGVIAAEPVLRLVTAGHILKPDHALKYLTHLHLDTILVGVLLALVFPALKARWSSWRWAAGGLGVALLLLVLADVASEAASFSAVVFAALPPVAAFAFAGLIAMTVLAPQSRWTQLCEQPLFSRMGRVSYGMYLLHFPVIDLVGRNWPSFSTLPPLSRSIGLFLVCALVTWALAEVMFVALERPFLRLKARVGYATATAS